MGSMRYLDLDALRAGCEVLNSGYLFFDYCAKSIRDSHANADDAGFHP